MRQCPFLANVDGLCVQPDRYGLFHSSSDIRSLEREGIYEYASNVVNIR